MDSFVPGLDIANVIRLAEAGSLCIFSSLYLRVFAYIGMECKKADALICPKNLLFVAFVHVHKLMSALDSANRRR